MRRLALFAAWLALGWVFATWLAMVGMDVPSRRIVVYLLGLGLLAIAFEGIWRRSQGVALGCVLLWALWVVGSSGFFWLTFTALVLPDAVRLTQAGVDHALRAPGADAAGESRGVLAAALERGLRAVLLIGAGFLLVHAFGLDMATLASSDTMWTRLARGVVHALAILLVADLAWKVSAALIDERLATVQPPADSDPQEEKQRLRAISSRRKP